jgi:hypothetical protein
MFLATFADAGVDARCCSAGGVLGASGVVIKYRIDWSGSIEG